VRSEDLAFLGAIRGYELEAMCRFLPSRGRILDYGAGPGQQSLQLRQMGFDVEAVDIADSAYVAQRVFPVQTYDGKVLPFPDGCFDAVVSSNVLEHVMDLPQVLRELNRVLKPDGLMVHVMPTATWRLWTTLAEFPAAPRNALRGLRSIPGNRGARARLPAWRQKLMQTGWLVRPLLFRPHGAFGSSLAELWTFSRYRWKRIFAREGFEVAHLKPLTLWYTGEILTGPRLSLQSRMRLARHLGSATTMYIVKPRYGPRI
jgi:SAM-dependent methyltransferase